MQDTVRVLMLGDVIGDPGLRALFAGLPGLIKKTRADLVVANGENAAGGFGITREAAERMFSLGIDVITTGNHVWEKKDIDKLLDSEPRILRPANYPAGAPGSGFRAFEKDGVPWLVLSLQGRERLYPIDCPFRTAKEILKRHKSHLAVIDFHAEATEEKEALGFHLDGEASVVAGTHTHVQTADERILPGGTGYITDLGMSGPADSVIGVKTEICLRRSLTQMPLKMESAEGEAGIQGALFEVDVRSRRTLSILRIRS
ncbi:MAG TPA: TIGR00282 family metallophosphoesterase [Spirochaetia bacterium]|nr:TIGR00282 family metallophosphoesterase [Spirochaetia bacterium]HRZ90372.1 TIGR00282 family metallophosphoesterase [Spirochaetia bacterium]